jgi:hypothetical protein
MASALKKISSKPDKNAKKIAQRAKFAAGIDKFIGPEPRPEDIQKESGIAMALSWYNYNYNVKDMIPWIVQFMEATNYSAAQIALFKSAPDWRTPMSAGSIARIINQGGTLPQDYIDRCHANIDATISWADNQKALTSKPKSTLTVSDRVKEKVNAMLGDFEEEIDNFISNGYSSTFDPYAYMKKNEIKAGQSLSIAEFYKPLRDQLVEAIAGKDAQLKEAYSKVTKANLKKYLEFVESFISNSEAAAQVTKTIRKARKPKVKSAAQLTDKMNFLAESAQYKIASVDPSKIIGAQTLVVVNTKYKKLGMYVASSPEGLSVRGSTIVGFDETKSINKTMRKPEQIIPSVVQSGKLALKKVWEGIKTAESPLTGRINKETILLRVF